MNPGSCVVLLEITCPGGAANFAERLLDQLVLRFSSITVYFPPDRAAAPDTAALREKFGRAYSNTKIRTWPTRFEIRSGGGIGIGSIFERIWIKARARDASLLVISTITPGRFLYLAKQTSRKAIHFMHTYPYSVERKGNLFKRLAYPIIHYIRSQVVSNTIAGGCTLIAMSRGARRALCKAWALRRIEKNIVILPNFVEKAAEITAENNVMDGPYRIIATLGLVETFKNPRLWLDVAMNVCDRSSVARFYWYGDGSLLNAMRRVTPSRYNGRIVWQGNTEKPRNVLVETAIYFQPSKIESQGLAVLEAMSAGKPCVVSNVGGLPESVIDGINGRVCKTDTSHEYAQAILDLLADPVLVKNMGFESRKLAETRFNKNDWCTSLDRLIEAKVEDYRRERSV